MVFENTITRVGEAALTESILTRSIEELRDESVYELGRDSFHGCTRLWAADFPNLNKINTDAFRDCSKLKVLILRNSLMCSLSYNALYGTPIANGTGYVYVPKSLENTYKQSSSWSALANQIRAIEDYPEMCDPFTTSWTLLAESIEAGTYKTEYAVGDTALLNLGSEGVVNMQIAAFDTDDLADGTGKAAITWVAKEMLATFRSVQTRGLAIEDGWLTCSLRRDLRNVISALVPIKVKNQIVEVSKTQESYSGNGATTTDTLWIPSKTEVTTTYAAILGTAAQRTKIKAGTGSSGAWWLRDTASSWSWRYVKVAGTLTDDVYENKSGVVLGFCTGKAK